MPFFEDRYSSPPRRVASTAAILSSLQACVSTYLRGNETPLTRARNESMRTSPVRGEGRIRAAAVMVGGWRAATLLESHDCCARWRGSRAPSRGFLCRRGDVPERQRAGFSVLTDCEPAECTDTRDARGFDKSRTGAASGKRTTPNYREALTRLAGSPVTLCRCISAAPGRLGCHDPAPGRKENRIGLCRQSQNHPSSSMGRTRAT